MKSVRSSLVLAAVMLVALTLGGYFLLRLAQPESDSALAAESPSAVESAAIAEREAEPIAPRPEGGVEEPVRTHIAPEEETVDAAPEASGLPARLVLEGELVIEELDGTVTRDATGTLEWVLWLGNGGQHETVELVEGHFRLELQLDDDAAYAGSDSNHSSEVRNALLQAKPPTLTEEGAPVVPVDETQRFSFGQEGVVVRFRRVSGTLWLLVEDAASGLPLQDVTVLVKSNWRHGDEQHPGGEPRKALIEHGRSPVMLAPEGRHAVASDLKCLVGSPGYAWAAVQLDFRAGGERRVGLVPGGDLDVYLSPEPDQAGLALQLREVGESRPFTTHAIDGEQPLSFDGLPPGDYRLTVELGDWYDDPLELAAEVVQVVAGRAHEVTLMLEELPELVEAPVSGQVVVPAEWGLGSFYVSFELLGAPLDGGEGRHVRNWSQSASEVYPFDLGTIQTGTYEMTLSDVEYGQVFDVGPGGRSDIVLELPPPVDVTVLVRDATTGLPAELDRLLWNCERPPGVDGGGLEPAKREAGHERFHLRVPRAKIHLMTDAGRYVTGYASFQAEQGLEVVVDVRPAAAARIRMRVGDTPVPWPVTDWGQGEHLDGDGRLGVRSHRDGGLWFTVTLPGRYRIDVPPVDGYEPIGSVEVDLVEGETQEVVLELVRLP